jgi:cell division transport system permease protein
VSRENAAKILKEDLGENFEEFLGYNPLMPSFSITLKNNYANPDSLILIKTEISGFLGVKEVRYQETVLQLVHKNIQNIAIILGGLCVLLGFIAITLINNAIRLSLYSRRFLVKSMQLVGATQGFIRKPFLLKSMLNGLLAGIIAVLMLGALVYFSNSQSLSLAQTDGYLVYGLFGGLVVLGVLVALCSTYFAINKYLRTRSEDLYE